jgi:Immunity protein 39
MAHNRKFVLAGVALTQAKLPAKQTALAMGQARDEIEQEIISSGYLEAAPFRWVGLVIREGLKDETQPHYKKIDAKDGELPVAIEIDTHRLLGATGEQMVAIYRQASLVALAHAGEKYGLNTTRVDQLLMESAAEETKAR